MEVTGWVGTALVVVAYYSQIHHLFVERCAWGISVLTRLIWLIVIALLVFAASFYLRTAGGAEWVGDSYTVPVLLSVAGVILITISGYLGGELVFGHGVAVNPQSDTRAELRGKARNA